MAHLRVSSILVLGLLLTAPQARGLGLLADDRRVSNTSGDGAAATFFAPFDVDFPSAGQVSSITVTPDGLGLDGSARGGASGSFGYVIDPDGNPQWTFIGGTSVFSIGFRIDGDGQLTLDGILSSFGVESGGVSVRVLAGDEVLYAQQGTPSGFEHPFDFASTLTPGEYTIEARANAGGVDLALGFDLTFQVRDSAVPVPEPATAMALAIGLTGIAARRPIRRLRISSR